jgi:hypothetical protein
LHGVGDLYAAFGGEARVLLAVAVFEGSLVFGDSLVALAVEVEHAAQVDVRPGDEARLLAVGQRLLEAVDGFAGMAGDDGDARQDKVGPGRVCDGLKAAVGAL